MFYIKYCITVIRQVKQICCLKFPISQDKTTNVLAFQFKTVCSYPQTFRCCLSIRNKNLINSKGKFQCQSDLPLEIKQSRQRSIKVKLFKILKDIIDVTRAVPCALGAVVALVVVLYEGCVACVVRCDDKRSHARIRRRDDLDGEAEDL